LVISGRLKDKLNEFIETHPPPSCPVCNCGTVLISDKIFELREYDIDSNNASRSIEAVFPLVVFICSKCGYVHLISAASLGLKKEESIR
jgi:hypothetical protein